MCYILNLNCLQNVPYYILSKKKFKIPLNEDSYFIIKKGHWNYTVDIIIENYFDFNIFNLFYIFKSYVYENDIYFRNVYLIVAMNNEISYTYKKIDIKLIKTCNFSIFVRFIEDLISNEKEYLKEYKYVGFTLVFDKYSDICIDDKIYPIYPWDQDIKENMLNNSIYTEKHSSKLKFFEDYKKKIDEIYKEKEKEIIEKYEKKEKNLLEKITFLENELKK